MSNSLHLSHKLPWDSLVQYYKKYKYPAIKLPVGDCKKIHIINNKIKHKVKNKKFLEDQICTNTNGDCGKVIKEIYFRKNTKFINGPVINSSYRHRNGEFDHLRLLFFNKFRETIFEFIETIKVNEKNPTYDYDYYNRYNDLSLTTCNDCNYFIMLIETKNTELLESSYSTDQLCELFRCTHGGQAVGRNLPFLFHYVFYIYIITNIIYCISTSDSNFNIKNYDTWCPQMSKDRYFRSHLMYACDGQTFPPTLRKYLKDDVYFKDLNTTRTLCKRLFEFICLYTKMEMKISPNNLQIDSYSDMTFYI